MRILYVATDQVVPGTLGGSVHVQAVAEGLAALGHDVHVATRRDAGRVDARVHWHALGAPGTLWTSSSRSSRRGWRSASSARAT